MNLYGKPYTGHDYDGPIPRGITMNETHSYADEQAGAQQEGPLTPYAGTSGWSGSETSRERAETEDADGTTSVRQTATMREVSEHGVYGVTVKELREITGWHHGRASAALSVLHKEGRLARLTDRRDRCAIYVTLDDVRGRETAAHRANKATVSVLTAYEMAVLRSVRPVIEGGYPVSNREARVIFEALERVTGE